MDTFNVGGLKSSLDISGDDEGVFKVSDMKQSLLDIVDPVDESDVDMMDISIDHAPNDPVAHGTNGPVNHGTNEPVHVQNRQSQHSTSCSTPKMNELVIRPAQSTKPPEKTDNAMKISPDASQHLRQSNENSNNKYHTLHLIYWCVHIFLNLTAWGVLFYIVYFIFKCFAADVDGRRQYQQANMAIEIASCLKNYVTNKCMPDQRAPMLETKCMEWEKCLNLDPDTHISTLKLCAETILDILSVFTAPLKDLSYSAYLGLFLCYLSALALNRYIYR